MCYTETEVQTYFVHKTIHSKHQLSCSNSHHFRLHGIMDALQRETYRKSGDLSLLPKKETPIKHGRYISVKAYQIREI